MELSLTIVAEAGSALLKEKEKLKQDLHAQRLCPIFITQKGCFQCLKIALCKTLFELHCLSTHLGKEHNWLDV